MTAILTYCAVNVFTPARERDTLIVVHMGVSNIYIVILKCRHVPIRVQDVFVGNDNMIMIFCK